MEFQSTEQKRRHIRWHVIFWMVLVYSSTMGFSSGRLKLDLSPFVLTWLITFAIAFYTNYLLVLPRVFRRLRWWKGIIGFLIMAIFYILIRYLIEEQIVAYIIGNGNYYSGTTIRHYVIDNLYYGSQPIIASTIFWLIMSTVTLAEQNKRIIEEQKDTEIKFLRAQINPHFVFNTLNNIYSMVHFNSPQSLPAIEKLSSIMRFTTYHAHLSQIRIAEEIDYIHAYIELEELRHSGGALVLASINVADMDFEIPPYILSPFVENALKHGAYSKDEPIEITLDCNEEVLRFEIKNKIGRQKKDKLGGIGLANLKTRLGLLFPGRYKMETGAKDEIFTAVLEIRWKGKI